MPIVSKLVEKLQRHPKRIVFPDGHDPRVLQAARQWVARRMGAPILLGNRVQIKSSAQQLDINLQGIRIIEPERSEDFEHFAAEYATLNLNKGISIEDARLLMKDTGYYAAMMLDMAQADAIISGAADSASNTLRPILQLLPRHPLAQTISSMMILDFDELKVGSGGTLFLADCGVIPNPSAQQLCDIAVSTAMIAKHLTNETPRVAMLSYETQSRSDDPLVTKVRKATQLARDKALSAQLQMEIEGEIQVDAALDPHIASVKHLSGPVAGRANVLIFPDLNSANISFKFAHHLAGGYAYGQILTGISKPAAQISRGSSAHDIYGTAVILGCQAIDERLLYGTES